MHSQLVIGLLTDVILFHIAASIFFYIFSKLSLGIDYRVQLNIAAFFALSCLAVVFFSFQSIADKPIGIFISNASWFLSFLMLYCAMYLRKHGELPSNILKIAMFLLIVCVLVLKIGVFYYWFPSLLARELVFNLFACGFLFAIARQISIQGTHVTFGEAIAKVCIGLCMLIFVIGLTDLMVFDDLNQYVLTTLISQNLSAFILAGGLITLTLADLANKYYRSSIYDELTGVFNRRFFYEAIKSQISGSQRYKHSCSVILCDIDHFKRINDRYGHDAGDKMLVAFSALLQKQIRQSDVFARLGGEEFVFFLPETNAEAVFEIALRLQQCVRELVLDYSGMELRITASFGVSTLLEGQTVDELIKNADDALYRAKEGGRNLVVAAASP